MGQGAYKKSTCARTVLAKVGVYTESCRWTNNGHQTELQNVRNANPKRYGRVPLRASKMLQNSAARKVA